MANNRHHRIDIHSISRLIGTVKQVIVSFLYKPRTFSNNVRLPFQILPFDKFDLDCFVGTGRVGGFFTSCYSTVVDTYIEVQNY